MKAYFEEELSKMSKIMLNAYDWEILAEYKNKVRRRSGGDVYK